LVLSDEATLDILAVRVELLWSLVQNANGWNGLG